MRAYVPANNGIQKLKDGIAGPIGETCDHPYAEGHQYLSGGGGLCSTASDYMRFCQMLLNKGELNGQRLLKPQTVEMMTKNQIGDIETIDDDVTDRFGYGFTMYSKEQSRHEQLQAAYAWFGHWTTSFRISTQGDWILITMSQLSWDENVTPKWFAQYEKIAAEAITN